MHFPNSVHETIAELSINTQKTYIAALTNLFKKGFGSDKYVYKYLKDYDAIEQYVKTLSDVYAKLVLLVVARVIRDEELKTRYEALAKVYKKKDDNKRIKQKLTDTEKENMLTWKEVIQLRNEYKEYDSNSKEYLLLCLYTYIPPQRGQVFYTCFILRHVPEHEYDDKNYIDLENRKLVVNNHKTKKTYGKITIDLCNELMPILINWHNMYGDGYLIKNNNKPYNSHDFTQFMYSIFGMKISTDMLRKIFISDVATRDVVSSDERKRLSDIMGHALSTQEFIYNRF